MSIQERINRWLLSDEGDKIQEVNELITYLGNALYQDYEPTTSPWPDFWHRLEAWLDNVEDEYRQQILFRLVPNIFFVGRHEFDTLYRVAFNEHIVRWIIDELGVRLNEPKLQKKINTAIANTWFCPITDSLRINAFHHVNNLRGHALRPDWKSLARLGDPKKVGRYLEDKRIERIVLLEDFVGSGSQMTEAVEFVAGLPIAKPTLVVPLIVCPNGMICAEELSKKYPTIKVSPVILLDHNAILSPEVQADEPSFSAQIRDIINTAKGKCGLDLRAEEKNNYYGMYGYRDTGSLVVTFSNCPNNTLPIIHHARNWQPLFPRSSRA